MRPDATIQVRGLGKLMRRVLKDNGDLAFRIQLAKSSLQIDTAPTENTVLTYANRLMAEVEQIARQDKKRREETKPAKKDPRMKKAEEEKYPPAKGEGKGGKGSEKAGLPCKFFNTEEGCRKGKLCAWAHVVEGDKKRCWNCGSTSHFSPACERPREPPKEQWSPGRTGKGEGKQSWKNSSKTLRKEDTPKKEETEVDAGEKDKEEPAAKQTMEELLLEANKMLKSLSLKGEVAPHELSA